MEENIGERDGKAEDTWREMEKNTKDVEELKAEKIKTRERKELNVHSTQTTALVLTRRLTTTQSTDT